MPIHAPFVRRVQEIELDGWVHESANATHNLVNVFEGYGSLEHFATSWTNVDNQ